MIRAFALAALTFGGCATAGSDAPATVPPGNSETANPTGATLGVPFRITLGATAEAAGLPIRFIEVVGDSRCPQGVTCVWEGRASVRLVAGETTTVLTVPHSGPESPDEPHSVVVNGRKVSLTALTPFPGSAEADRGAPVQVELLVDFLPD